MVDIVDPDQMSRLMGLHCLPETVCRNTLGHYGTDSAENGYRLNKGAVLEQCFYLRFWEATPAFKSGKR